MGRVAVIQLVPQSTFFLLLLTDFSTKEDFENKIEDWFLK